MIEGFLKVLLAERKLADSPNLGVLQGEEESISRPASMSPSIRDRDLTYRLECLLDLGVQSACLQRNDLGCRIRVMSNRRATFRAEDAVDGVARRSLTSPALGGAFHSESGLRDHRHQSY